MVLRDSYSNLKKATFISIKVSTICW